MVLFKKDINLSMDDRSMKIAAAAVVAVIAIVIAALVIYPKVDELMDKMKDVEKAKLEWIAKDEEAKRKENEVKEILAKYDENRKYLDEIKERFINASVTEETDLKIAVQRLITNLNLQMKETGATELAEDMQDVGYQKRFIPYIITGDFSNIGKFLYYLENSKWLITFNGSNLNLKKVKDKERDVIEVKLKIGAYYVNPDAVRQYYQQ
jgi:hypothetical protein